MTTTDLGAPAPSPVPAMAPLAPPNDHRGSWIPTVAMIATRFMELRKRRGLMITVILVTIGIPSVFLGIRLLLHAVSPHSYGPAGGHDIYTALVAGVLFVFGFIVAATLGCTAGSIDLTEGMFRHLVVTGRSRLALYLARIPAGLAIILPLVAIGFTVVCFVCVFAAPTSISYNGASVPAGLSLTQFENWAADHSTFVLCNFPGPSPQTLPCNGPNTGPGSSSGVIVKGPPGSAVPSQQPSPATLRTLAVQNAKQDYADYSTFFLYPSNSLMIRSGLWIELEAVIGFMVGLGLGSLLGQRTVAVILMIVLEIVLTPIFSHARIPHFINLQRGVVGLATLHLEPAGLPRAFGGGGMDRLVPESTTVAVCVIVAWLVIWTALGAWRMMTRDA